MIRQASAAVRAAIPPALRVGASAALVLGWLLSAGCADFSKCGLHECPADAKITAQVRSLIAQTPSLEGPNRVSVQTVNGVVYLRGLVSTPAQIEAAGALAEQVPGVTQVENLIVIDNAH